MRSLVSMTSQPHAPAAAATVFVRNLPYDTDSDALAELFGECGPVRKCFIVKDKGACPPGAVAQLLSPCTVADDGPSVASSRGFGFVQLCVACVRAASEALTAASAAPWRRTLRAQCSRSRAASGEAGRFTWRLQKSARR